MKLKRKQKLQANKSSEDSFNLATKFKGSGKKQLNLNVTKSESYQDSKEKCNDILFMLFYL